MLNALFSRFVFKLRFVEFADSSGVNAPTTAGFQATSLTPLHVELGREIQDRFSGAGSGPLLLLLVRIRDDGFTDSSHSPREGGFECLPDAESKAAQCFLCRSRLLCRTLSSLRT